MWQRKSRRNEDKLIAVLNPLLFSPLRTIAGKEGGGIHLAFLPQSYWKFPLLSHRLTGQPSILLQREEDHVSSLLPSSSFAPSPKIER